MVLETNTPTAPCGHFMYLIVKVIELPSLQQAKCTISITYTAQFTTHHSAHHSAHHTTPHTIPHHTTHNLPPFIPSPNRTIRTLNPIIPSQCKPLYVHSIHPITTPTTLPMAPPLTISSYYPTPSLLYHSINSTTPLLQCNLHHQTLVPYPSSPPQTHPILAPQPTTPSLTSLPPPNTMPPTLTLP